MYDGAAVMIGRKRGLQSLMHAEVCPRRYMCVTLIYSVVLSSVFLIPKAVAFFDQLDMLHKFFPATVLHNRFVQTQHRLRENVQEADALRMKELTSLSKTRWCSKEGACDAIIATLGSIIDCVEFVAEDNNPDRRAAAEVIVGFVDTDFIKKICNLLPTGL